MRRSRFHSEKTVSLKSPFDLKKNQSPLLLRMASVRITHMSRNEVMERLEQLAAANVAYTLVDNKSTLHELEEKVTKSEMNDNLDVCAGLSQI